jgi:hypothetical protein
MFHWLRDHRRAGWEAFVCANLPQRSPFYMTVMLDMTDTADGFSFTPRSPHCSRWLNPYDSEVLINI